MEINLICVGKIKEHYFVSGIEEYLKRMKPLANIRILEIKEFHHLDYDRNLKEEAILMLEILPKDAHIVTLEIEGKQKSSVELAELIENHYTYQSKPLYFIIGSSHGLDDEIKKRSHLALSFSKMTFPHQLMRLLFLEQIYRSLTIIHNQKYHK